MLLSSGLCLSIQFVKKRLHDLNSFLQSRFEQFSQRGVLFPASLGQLVYAARSLGLVLPLTLEQPLPLEQAQQGIDGTGIARPGTHGVRLEPAHNVIPIAMALREQVQEVEIPQRWEDAIIKAKEDKDADNRKVLQKELKGYLKQMKGKKAAESRQLLKEHFDYSIFMYEAEKVGISATGEEDQNELYPNANQPEGVKKTCLEWYREFLANPEDFLGEEE